MGPKSTVTGVLIRREESHKDGHTGSKQSCDGEDWSDVQL